MAEEQHTGKTEDLPSRENPAAPTIYSDGIIGMILVESIVKMNFTQTTFHVPEAGKAPAAFNEPVLRLVVPIGAFSRMVDFMFEQREAMRSQGLLPAAGTEKNAG